VPSQVLCRSLWLTSHQGVLFQFCDVAEVTNLARFGDKKILKFENSNLASFNILGYLLQLRIESGNLKRIN
jgi:hypothetical protein